MGGDVVGLVALDLVLRLILRGAARVALIVEIAFVNLGDPALTQPASEFHFT